MCQFCDNLDWKTYIISQRTTSADDNQCEFGSPLFCNGEVFDFTCDNCDGCKEENVHFGLTLNNNTFHLSYVHRINKLIIEPYSEPIQINFCPWCGRTLADKQVEFDECCLGTKLKIKREINYKSK